MSNIVSFDAIKATAQAVLEIAKLIQVTDAESAAKAKFQADEIKRLLDRVEEIRKALVKPVDEEREKIQGDAKGISGPLKEGRDGINARIKAWQDAEREKAEAIAEEERKAAEARLAETLADDNASIEDVERVTAHVEVASKPVKMSKSLKPLKTRENWKFTVTDFKALVQHALATDSLWMLSPNESEIGKKVRAANAPMRQCPGLEIYSEEGLG